MVVKMTLEQLDCNINIVYVIQTEQIQIQIQMGGTLLLFSTRVGDFYFHVGKRNTAN